jgi:hypothetical protein
VGEGELRLARDQPDVALHGERQPDTDGVAVDRGDHRLAHFPGRKRDRVGAELGLFALRERVGPHRHVGADAERAARTGHDDSAHVVTGIALAIRGRERGSHGPGEGVALRGAVEGEQGDAVGNVHLQIRVGHPHPSLKPRTMSATASESVSL